LLQTPGKAFFPDLRCAVPSVASQAKVILPRWRQPAGLHNAAEARSKPATPFAELLDSANPPSDPPSVPRPARVDRTERPERSDTSKPADANHTDLTAKPDAANSDADNAAGPPTALSRPLATARSRGTPRSPKPMPPPPQMQPAAQRPCKLRRCRRRDSRRAPPGSSRFEIRLVPPKRDRIDVKRHVDRDGHVSSRLVVNRANTLDMLRRDRHRSSARSSRPALKTSDNALDFSLRQQGFARDDDPTPAVTQVVLPDDDPASLEALRQRYGA
jgi:flagellar hook-length control protein FliK